MPKATILIVEDEAIVAEDLSQKLGRLGYEVRGITSRGEEAVALARDRPPDVVLMDIRLQGAMDGVEAAEHIRRQCAVPVIFLTAHSDRETLERAKLAEPFGYILKPFEELELETHIEMALYKHQAEQALRRHREWLRVTLSSIGDAVLATDTARRITFVNPVAAALTGWQQEQAMGQPVENVFRIINEQTREWAESVVAQVLRENRVVGLANHTALIARDGREIPVEDSAAPIRDAGGKVSGAVLVFHDVTGKRRAQEALRESERRERERAAELATILDAVPTPVIIVKDPESRHMTGNRAADELLRHPRGSESSLSAPAETKPRHFKAFKDGRELRLDELPAQRAARGEAVRDFEFRLVFDDGTVRDVLGYGTPLLDEQGSPRGAVHVLVDITERKRAEEALRQTNEELIRFNSAAVGRELRMVELKKEVNELCAQAGQPPPYPLDSGEEQP